jgi:hypothetical protein
MMGRVGSIEASLSMMRLNKVILRNNLRGMERVRSTIYLGAS